MKVFGYILAGFAALGILWLALLAVSVINTAGNVASTPMRVINRTVSTENVINSYNGFYKLMATFSTSVKSIQDYTASFSGETDVDQLRMYRTNVFGMRVVCRDLANKYNASAEKLTSSWFRDGRLPSELNPQECDQ